MSIPFQPSLFALVERTWTGRNPVPELRLLTASESTGEGGTVNLKRVRQMLYDRCVEPATRAALWHQIAERVRLDTDRSHWPSAGVWLGLPGLRHTSSRITRFLGAERADVEAELVTCYLEALTDIGDQTPDPGGLVLRSACSRAWTMWSRVRSEVAVEDMDRRGDLHFDADTEGSWQVDYKPPAGRPGLSADLRIVVPEHRVEGVRIGALAQAWGLADTADCTAYSGRGRQVARVSLRRGGRKA